MSARGFADRWPFRRKLNLLVGVPLAVVAALLAYLISDQGRQSQNASDAARLVRSSTEVATLVDRLAAEHQQAILLSVRHEATFDGGTPSTSAYRAAQIEVDNQVGRVRERFGDQLPAEEARALKEVEALESLRDSVQQAYVPATNVDPAYSTAAKGLIDGLGLDHDSNLSATFTGNLLDSLLRADAAHSSYETGVFSATTGDSNALMEFIGAIGSYDEYTHQADRFARFATEEQVSRLAKIEHNSSQGVINRQYAELQIDPGAVQADSPAQIRKSLSRAIESYPSYRKQASIRLGTTTTLIDEIADRADTASHESLRTALLLLALALFGFLAWFAFSVTVRRSVVRPVQALTGAAQQVAQAADRELARVADDDAEDDTPPRLGAMPVTARDEIGDLAEAFDHVRSTAAALLQRQALSRRNVAEMFGNVGRRVSNLTSRQLALIDAVERGETDPELLERLYSIDHIAVRLRRNADSLMLLAGIRETGLGQGPTALTNVVRAALGQIEGFRRVQLRARTETLVEPDVIGDLTLMVAELVENAVSFSPADSPVEVYVQGTPDGAVVVVADHGIGMTPERLAEENARIVRRERLDVVPTKVLGLFVVGSLARRWDIGVTLTRTAGGGVTAEVTLPQSLLLATATVRTPVPTPPATEPEESGPRPSAAEPDGPLPRRVPRREDEPEAGPETPAPFIPQARKGDAPAPAAANGSRPLRRRVRGATLQRTADAATHPAGTGEAPRPADADAVRAALEEFEAAVEQAHRDTGTAGGADTSTPAAVDTDPHPQDQNHHPEGAEQ